MHPISVLFMPGKRAGNLMIGKKGWCEVCHRGCCAEIKSPTCERGSALTHSSAHVTSPDAKRVIEQADAASYRCAGPHRYKECNVS